MVAQGLHLVLGQRLARRLCPACKRPVKITPEQRERMGKPGEGVEEIHIPLGCPRCLGTGYLGRQGFFELLAVNDALREVILRSPTPQEIRRVLSESGFLRLADTGFDLVARGLTSFDEIDRAIGRDARIITG
jgi:type II secretory ATPase GspE/PulE/Tfp pilus assembly ATPase PilB-like protein